MAHKATGSSSSDHDPRRETLSGARVSASAFAAKAGRPVELGRGEFLFRQGDECHSFYYLEWGKLHIFTTFGKRDLSVKRPIRGELFGFRCFGQRSASCQCLEGSRVIEVAREHFEPNDDLRRSFNEMRKSIADHETIMIQTAIERVQICDQNGSSQSGRH